MTETETKQIQITLSDRELNHILGALNEYYYLLKKQKSLEIPDMDAFRKEISDLSFRLMAAYDVGQKQERKNTA